MRTKFYIGDALDFKVDCRIQFVCEGREIDTDELKVAVELFIRQWISDPDCCPVIEKGVKHESCN